MATGMDVVAEAEPAHPAGRRGRVVFMWIFAGVALCVMVALAIAAGRLEIALAAAVGLVVPVALVTLSRRARRRSGPATTTRRRWRWAWWLSAAVLVAVVGLASVVLVRETNPPSSAVVTPLQTVDYHAEGRATGNQIVLEETIVLNERAITNTAPRKPAGADVAEQEPTVSVANWQEAGRVDGYPSFTRTRYLTWQHESVLADTAAIPLTIGYLTVRLGGQSSTAILAPQDGSKVEITVPKGSLGASVPAVVSQTDTPDAGRQEVIVYAVDKYVHDVSFDLLGSALRNPAGRTLYEMTRWGFWQWAAGAVTTVIGGLVVDKLAEAIWRRVSRRARSLIKPKGAQPA